MILVSVGLAFPRLSVRAADGDPDYTFDSGAVLIDSSYNGKNILIKNGVFSVAVNGATDVNIIFQDVTIDRRYSSDTAAGGQNNQTIGNLYSVSQSLGWGNKAQVCPLLITGGSDVTVAFRGANTFYAGVNGCTVSTAGVYTAAQSGGGYAGVQVDSGSSLTIEYGNLEVYGGHYVNADNSHNIKNTAGYVSDGNGYGWPQGAGSYISGGAGIGGGVTYNTSSSFGRGYTQGTPGTITINGGTISAYGGHQAAGIGGGLNGAATSTDITINNGNITARGGRWAAGIGDGDSLQNGYSGDFANEYHINILGGTIDAVGGVGCPGIGSTDSISAGVSPTTTSGLEITIDGGKVTVLPGYPDGFNPNGTSGYTGSDAAAAIGAGNKTNMQSNSISITSAAEILASSFGHYSITENGTSFNARPNVNIDSDGYLYLGRFPDLVDSASRIFELFEAQEENIDGTVYRKFVTQPADGSAGEVYYFSAEADKPLLNSAKEEVIPSGGTTSADYEALLQELKLSLYIDDTSVLIKSVQVLRHFRSMAMTLPKPEEHGGMYVLKVPVGSLYEYDDSTYKLPQAGYIAVTVSSQDSGTISGELVYPQANNISFDSVTEPFVDLDIYRDGQHQDGRDGLIGNRFYENVYAYTVYIESTDNTAYLWGRFLPENNTSVALHIDNASVFLGANDFFTYTVDMTGLDEKEVRIRKTDTVNGNVYNSIIYKITIIRKAVYKIDLKDLSKTYDGIAVNPAINELYSGTLPPSADYKEYIPTEDELDSAIYRFYSSAGGTTWQLLTDAPKDAGTYKVSATIDAESYTAAGEREFVIEKRTLHILGIENYLRYVTASEYASLTAPLAINAPGTFLLDNVIAADKGLVSASAASVYYNDISVGFGQSKITLEGITLSGAAADNYETAATQTVAGQISYSLDGAIFRKKLNSNWDKFYPVDSPNPVTAETADFHSPINAAGVYDSHVDYVYARTTGSGESGTVYAVDIEFGAMYFSYSKTRWNTDTLVYDELEGESKWDGFNGTNNKIEISNRSNATVTYSIDPRISFLHGAIGDSPHGIRAEITDTNGDAGNVVTGHTRTLSAATAGDHQNHGSPQTETSYLRLSGIPQFGEASGYTVVGKITVTISK